MLQRSTQQPYPQEQLSRRFAHPKRRDVIFHGVKTARLVKDLLFDPRVPVIRKLLFMGSIAAFVVVLFFPDLINEAIMSTVLPVIGTILGVPIDAGFDWLAFVLIGVSLLRFFPANIVSEHYRRIFDKDLM
ncbi:hypothetical protein [Dictyobacter arantiisoli]|uniref:DUF1232 domain-containing protein n=1 Tax=Dictyobacter arantiisoli TaxID=2014874 RepID=A0A5A5TFS8_9CHLR|nr:hypothetical protein [Dictyobacter arantiisoli]GCF10430.1 hypothetical protein KDI_39940 [Dictyobacter arantiisoli]